MNHTLKCYKEYFQDIIDKRKTFDLRINDRGFTIGDSVCLKEYDPITEQYTGREYNCVIIYMLERFPGLYPHYCILGIN